MLVLAFLPCSVVYLVPLVASLALPEVLVNESQQVGNRILVDVLWQRRCFTSSQCHHFVVLGHFANLEEFVPALPDVDKQILPRVRQSNLASLHQLASLQEQADHVHRVLGVVAVFEFQLSPVDILLSLLTEETLQLRGGESQKRT